MENKSYISLLLLAFIFITSCERDRDISFAEYEPKIVVEGWIENDKYAQVILTWSSSFNEKLDTLYLYRNIIKSAKVSVSNGNEIEVLTLGVNHDHLPPYVYYGSILKGQTGDNYELKIEYRNRVISAETFIPEPLTLDSCWFVKESPTDSTGYIQVKFVNQPGSYYQFATRISEIQTVFVPCLYGNLKSDQFQPHQQVAIQINKGPSLFPKADFETSFPIDKVVFLKFRTQAKESYDFWTSWQNEVLNGQNPIFPAHTSLRSNIKGGIGIWSGYGTSNYSITTNE